MAAYVIARVVHVGDTGVPAEYRSKLAPLVEKHGGKFLVRGSSTKERLEGKEKLPSTIVVLEFPSMEDARAWYNDPDYAELLLLPGLNWGTVAHSQRRDLPASITCV